jgi:hypothetical protein
MRSRVEVEVEAATIRCADFATADGFRAALALDGAFFTFHFTLFKKSDLPNLAVDSSDWPIQRRGSAGSGKRHQQRFWIGRSISFDK